MFCRELKDVIVLKDEERFKEFVKISKFQHLKG